MPNGDYEQRGVGAMSEPLPTEIVQHDELRYIKRSYHVFTGAPQYLPRATNGGDYEKRMAHDGTELYSGVCAGCGGRVEEGDPFIVLYSTDGTPGGIFHLAHQPTGPQWFGVGEEAPDL